MNKLIIALILLFFFLGQSVRGQEDNIKVSLMTCAPGTEIYALFGNTALRYEDKARGEGLSKIDEIKTLRGELPLEVQDLEDEIAGLSTRIDRIKAEVAPEK